MSHSGQLAGASYSKESLVTNRVVCGREPWDTACANWHDSTGVMRGWGLRGKSRKERRYTRREETIVTERSFLFI